MPGIPPPRIEAIVPAYNEEATVAATVRPLLRSGLARVVVVDDGSKDRTAQVAAREGAHVHQMPKNVGKGAAMKSAIDAALARGTQVLVFFDADLVGLTPGHVHKLVRPVCTGEACMVVGLQDRSPLVNMMQAAMPPISGQRAVRADVVRRVPEQFWRGYRIEMGLNRAGEVTGPVLLTVLPGLQAINKTAKVGAEQGTIQNLKMMREVLQAMQDARVAIR